MTISSGFLLALLLLWLAPLCHSATYSFLYTSGTRTYQSSCQAILVPTDANAMQVTLFGGSGGVNNNGGKSQGGRGGGISAILPVVTGTSYWVCVGGVGTDAGTTGASPGYGGWPGGGYSYTSGGGGGGTSLQTSSDSTAYTSRLLVAGGGYQGYNGASGGGVEGSGAVGAYSQVSYSMISSFVCPSASSLTRDADTRAYCSGRLILWSPAEQTLHIDHQTETTTSYSRSGRQQLSHRPTHTSLRMRSGQDWAGRHLEGHGSVAEIEPGAGEAQRAAAGRPGSSRICG